MICIILLNNSALLVDELFVKRFAYGKRFALCYRIAVCLSVTLLYCGQMVRWIKMKLGMEVGLCPSYIVSDGTQLPKGAQTLQFSAHVSCGQTAEWIKMPLDMEVNLGPGHIVLDGDQAPPPKGAQQPPLFGPCLLWPNGRPSQLLLSTCLTYQVGRI